MFLQGAALQFYLVVWIYNYTLEGSRAQRSRRSFSCDSEFLVSIFLLWGKCRTVEVLRTVEAG